MQEKCKALVIMLVLGVLVYIEKGKQVFMAPLPGIERINLINILTKEGNANLDIF